MFVWILITLFVLGSSRAYLVLARPLPSRKRSTNETCSLSAFLGSGGHTSEALLLLSTLDFGRYTPRIYIVSEGDVLSTEKAIALERSKKPEPKDYTILTIPRARHVHQSFFSTPPTFLKSLLHAFYRIFFLPAINRRSFADVLVLNGPGTCVPVCIAAYSSQLIGLPAPRIIYVESFARVSSMSLSAKLLRPAVNRFIVQWPQVFKNGKLVESHGWLV